MAEDKALGPLKAGLREMLVSGLYSDLQVHCADGTFYNVHKMVLCSQSAFFKSAVDSHNNFSDPYSNRIRLDKDEPAAVRALLEYLYRFEYDVPRDNDKGALFLFHIKVCAIGEAYGVKGLRDQAIDRAKIVFENAATLKELRMDLAIKAIYDMDVATDSGLRHLVVELCKGKIHELLEMGEFSEAMDSVGCFGNDLVRALVSTLPPSAVHSTHRSDAAASNVFTSLAVKGPSHGTFGNSNTRTPPVDAAGLSKTQENTPDGVGRVNLASGDQEISKAETPTNGTSASNTTFPAPQTQTRAQDNIRKSTASSLGASEALDSQEPFTFSNTNLSSFAVFPLSATKSMPLLGHVSVSGLPLIPTSRYGVWNLDHDFKPYIERDHFMEKDNYHQSMEFNTGYQQFSREEVRLVDYFPRTGSLPLRTASRNSVTASTDSQGLSSSESRSGVLGDAPLASTNTTGQIPFRPSFGASFGSASTSSTTTQGQFARKSRKPSDGIRAQIISGRRILVPSGPKAQYSSKLPPATGAANVPGSPNCAQDQVPDTEPASQFKRTKRSDSTSSTQSQKEAYELLFGTSRKNDHTPPKSQKGNSVGKKKGKAKIATVTTEVPC